MVALPGQADLHQFYYIEFNLCDLRSPCGKIVIMKTYWIIGGGHFGRRAAHLIRRKEANSEIVIIDKQSSICKQLDHSGFKTVCTEGIRYLETNLIAPDHPDWIIPSIPVHVAYEWIKSKLTRQYNVKPFPIPQQLKANLPNPFQADGDQLYVSNADFICPENCSEPDELCTYTGRPRPRSLNEFLNNFRYRDFRSVIVFSQQLFPGVGGYTPKALHNALTEIESLPDRILLGTACRCHGVLDAFKLSPIS